MKRPSVTAAVWLLISIMLTGCVSIAVDNWRPTLRLDNGDRITVKKQRGGAIVIWWRAL